MCEDVSRPYLYVYKFIYYKVIYLVTIVDSCKQKHGALPFSKAFSFLVRASYVHVHIFPRARPIRQNAKKLKEKERDEGKPRGEKQ